MDLATAGQIKQRTWEIVGACAGAGSAGPGAFAAVGASRAAAGLMVSMAVIVDDVILAGIGRAGATKLAEPSSHDAGAVRFSGVGVFVVCEERIDGGLWQR